MKSYARAAAVLLLASVFAACSKSQSTAAAGDAATATAKAGDAKGAAGDERHPLTGEIVSVDAARKILIVQHEEIKGYMPAMTMEFIVTAGDIAVAKPGQRIRAEMVVPKNGDPRLEKIWPDDKVTKDAVTAGAMKLRQDTFTRGKNAYREIGEEVPDFSLYDQEGKVVTGGRFRGKMLMVNFIYTRCPIATMCPASTMKMQSTQKSAREAGVKNIEFVSFTMDPAYDTPGVLKDYVASYGIDTSNFSLLTGPEAAIRDLLTQFGVIAEFKGDILNHTLTTLLIGEDGKIIHRADGSKWEPKEFVARMRK